MANALNENLDGKRVVIKKKYLKEQYHDEEKRTVEVMGGFGAKSFTSGTALFVRWPDGEESRVSGDWVERIIGDIEEENI